MAQTIIQISRNVIQEARIMIPMSRIMIPNGRGRSGNGADRVKRTKQGRERRFLYIFLRRKGMKSYIPKSYELFDLWFKFLVQYVTSKTSGSAPAWTHIPKAVLDMITDAYVAWYTVYSKTFGPHTPVDTLAKKEGRKAAERIIRPFVNQYLRFFPVTDEDRAAMGIPNRKDHRTPINPPATGPLFSIVQMGPGMLGIVYRNGEKGRKGSKPEGVEGARIYYGFEPVTDQDQLPISVWATRCPHTIRFRESDRGKRVYFALKWEIQKENGESPWSEIQSELIP
jgi:hypothetical protein